MSDDSDPPPRRERARSISPSSFARAIGSIEAASAKDSPASRVTIGIATTVGAALLVAVAGGIANFLVMRSEVATLRSDLSAHSLREGHEASLRQMDRFDARLEALGSTETQRAVDLNRRLGNLETTVNSIRDDQQEVLRSLPSAWRTREPSRPPR